MLTFGFAKFNVDVPSFPGELLRCRKVATMSEYVEDNYMTMI